VKKWYVNSYEENCPMCRAPIYFKGLYKLKKEWLDESWEIACAEIYEEALTSVVEESLEEYKLLLEDNDIEEYMDFEMLEEIKVDPLEFFAMHPDEQIEVFTRWYSKNVKSQLLAIESTYNFLKSYKVSCDEIEHILFDTDIRYSSRDINKYEYDDEPVREKVVRRFRGMGGKRGKRARAMRDIWSTIVVVFVYS